MSMVNLNTKRSTAQLSNVQTRWRGPGYEERWGERMFDDGQAAEKGSAYRSAT